MAFLERALSRHRSAINVNDPAKALGYKSTCKLCHGTANRSIPVKRVRCLGIWFQSLPASAVSASAPTHAWSATSTPRDGVATISHAYPQAGQVTTSGFGPPFSHAAIVWICRKTPSGEWRSSTAARAVARATARKNTRSLALRSNNRCLVACILIHSFVLRTQSCFRKSPRPKCFSSQT